jgi:hypothetical protein
LQDIAPLFKTLKNSGHRRISTAILKIPPSNASAWSASIATPESAWKIIIPEIFKHFLD